MLNEAPKKPKKKIDYAHPNGWQLFWRLQKEGWRRAVTPALMYFFMSLLLLASQAVTIVWLSIVLGVVCIAGGIFFNAHLVFHFGSAHYDTFLSGQLYRLREEEGVDSFARSSRRKGIPPVEGLLHRRAHRASRASSSASSRGRFEGTTARATARFGRSSCSRAAPSCPSRG